MVLSEEAGEEVRIICDMDEVLAEFVKKILHRWNSVNGTAFTKNDITQWRMENVLGKDITGRSADGLIDEWLAEPGFYEDLEPIEGAVEGFQKLCDLGHDLVICTSVPEVAVHAYDGKRRWMRRHFPKFSMKSFIASSRKGLIDGDILIDDGGHNMNDWCREGRSGALLMDNPWNRDVGMQLVYDGPTVLHGVEIRRVYDWNHILREIERISQERHESMMRSLYGVYS